jgi:hypothetical protein
MTPAEYGFAVGAGLQQGFSNIMAARQQSIREKAFQAELEQNERLFPLKVAQIENQTQAVKLQSEMQQYNLNLQRAQMGMMSAMAPIDTEMAFLAEANPNALSSYQIPDIKVDHPDPTFAKYASDLARQKLLEKKTSLLEATEDFQDRKTTADTLRQASRIPGIETPIKAQLKAAATKLRTGGYEALSEFEIQKLIPLAEREVYARSKDYREMLKGEREYGIKVSEAQSKRIGALAKVSEGLFTTEEARKAAERGISELVGGGPSKLEPSQTVERVAAQEVDLEPVKLKFKQGAEAVRRGADATEVIDRLATEILKVSGKADNPKNRMAARSLAAQKLQLGGLNVPSFAPQDFGDSQEEE